MYICQTFENTAKISLSQFVANISKHFSLLGLVTTNCNMSQADVAHLVSASKALCDNN